MIKKIAFICVGNSARSQMAEAIAKKMIKERNLDIEIFSAGTEPAGFINAMAIRVLEEDGIPIENQYSKGLQDIPIDDIDLFVMVCEESNCVFLPGKRTISWNLPDPFSYEQFYLIRESLKSKIGELLDNLVLELDKKQSD